MRIIVFVFSCLIFSVAAAQQLQEQVNVDLVEAYISALNSSGDPIEGLKADEFILKENGKEQPITYFSRLLDSESQIPLTIAFLVDTSGSMSLGNQKMKRIDIARVFSSLFLKEVKAGDSLQVFAFDNVFRELTPMTNDPAVVEKAFSQVKIDTQASPGTALLGAIDVTIKQLDPHFGRKILIICSDGQNNIPGPDPEVLIETLKKRDITALTLATVADDDFAQSSNRIQLDGPHGSMNIMSIRKERTTEAQQARKVMKEFAEETGGFAFFPENDSKLNEAIQKLRSVIRSQYVLSYKPPNREPGWREIKIECKRKGVKLRYRQHYYME
jgi:Ca-activated chloride channel family protein